MFFFFSSRRRHTRSLCDWSSDVCSSDLPPSASTPEDPIEKVIWETLDRLGATHRSEEHTSELQSHSDLVCRLLLEKKKGFGHRPIEVLDELQNPSLEVFKRANNGAAE